MKKRSFLLSLFAVAVAPWKAITTRKGYKPLLKQVFPQTPEELPGLYAHYVYDDQVFPYLIVREWDEFNDLWNGERLYNPRRNKWWAKDVNGETTLICTGAWFNDGSTWFFKKV